MKDIVVIILNRRNHFYMKIQNKNKQFLIWANLIDLGIESTLSILKKKVSSRQALRELNRVLRHRSEEHYQGLSKMLKRLLK